MMNRDILKGNWKQFRGLVKLQWGRLTDDDLTRAEGEFDRLVGLIQKKYGLARGEAKRQVEVFLNRFELETER